MKLHLSNEVETDEADRSFASGARHALVPGALEETQRERVGEKVLQAFRAALLEPLMEEEAIVECIGGEDLATSSMTLLDLNGRTQERLPEPVEFGGRAGKLWHSSNQCAGLTSDGEKSPLMEEWIAVSTAGPSGHFRIGTAELACQMDSLTVDLSAQLKRLALLHGMLVDRILRELPPPDVSAVNSRWLPLECELKTFDCDVSTQLVSSQQRDATARAQRDFATHLVSLIPDYIVAVTACLYTGIESRQDVWGQVTVSDKVRKNLVRLGLLTTSCAVSAAKDFLVDDPKPSFPLLEHKRL